MFLAAPQALTALGGLWSPWVSHQGPTGNGKTDPKQLEGKDTVSESKGKVSEMSYITNIASYNLTN